MYKKIIKDVGNYNNGSIGLDESLFYNGNGYLGVRGCLEEGVPKGIDTMRGTYINGFYDIVSMKQAENLCNFVEEKETILNVVDIQTINLYVNKQKFALHEGTILKQVRELDMQNGYTSREIHWKSPNGEEVLIVIKRMASFEELSLFMIDYSVAALNFSGEVVLESVHDANVSNYCNPNDPRMAAEAEQCLYVENEFAENSTSYIVSHTKRSNLQVASAVAHEMKENRVVSSVEMKQCGKWVHTFKVVLEEQQKVSLKKYCLLIDSRRENNLMEYLKQKCTNVLDKGFYFYYQKQKEYLESFWEASMLDVKGDEEINKALNFNMYQLLQSVSKDSIGNIGAKGLSGEGYEGHYFWDTEMFILPFFVLTNPELAKKLLEYRYTILDAARNNAGLLGHKKGALFPWRTITGVECSGYYPSGTAQYHINGDIAYAITSYYFATGDWEFIKNAGIEILIETARLWMDVGNYADDKFVINSVTGPDEYTCMVNNNYYTNRVAKHNLEWAVKLYRKLENEGQETKLKEKLYINEEEIKEMEQACEKMYLPFDEKMQIIPQDDSFLSKPVWNLEDTPKEKFPLLLNYHPLCLYRYQVCKQADAVLAFFLFGDELDNTIMKNSFEYYEKITTHDSSLSKCIFSIVASRLGLEDKAYTYLGNSAELDLKNTHNNTKDGIHTANMGGCYMAVVYGFAGLRIEEAKIAFHPIVPSAWEGYHFKVRYQQSLLDINVTTDQIIILLDQGNAVGVKVYQQEYILTKDTPIVCGYRR